MKGEETSVDDLVKTWKEKLRQMRDTESQLVVIIDGINQVIEIYIFFINIWSTTILTLKSLVSL